MLRKLFRVLAAMPLLVFLLLITIILVVGPAIAQVAAGAPDATAALGDQLRQAAGQAWGLIATLVTVASLITAGTATPSPTTRFGRLYHLIETLAMVNNNAKDPGTAAAAARPAAPVRPLPPAAVVLALVLAGLSLSACSYLTTLTGTAAAPLTPAQMQQNLASVNYLLQATGCALSAEATTAAPIVQISADAKGNQVLAAVNAAGGLLCKLTVPATAIPVPAAPNAPVASVPLAAVPAAPAG